MNSGRWKASAKTRPRIHPHVAGNRVAFGFGLFREGAREMFERPPMPAEVGGDEPPHLAAEIGGSLDWKRRKQSRRATKQGVFDAMAQMDPVETHELRGGGKGAAERLIAVCQRPRQECARNDHKTVPLNCPSAAQVEPDWGSVAFSFALGQRTSWPKLRSLE